MPKHDNRTLDEVIADMHVEMSESVRRQFGMSEADIAEAIIREAELFCPNYRNLPSELPMRNGRMVKITDKPWTQKHGDEVEAILTYQYPGIPDAAWEAWGG
jgi:hypothetical protein